MDERGRILVIDDESGIRQGCRRVLEPQGFAVRTAATIHEGREHLAAADFDLVLLDVMMPDGRGVDLIAPLHERDPEAVVVIITGYATVELAVEAIRRGAYDFLSKPFTADLLLMTVNQALERRRLSLETRRLQAVEQEAAELARAQTEAERLCQFQATYTTLVAHELRAPVGASLSLLRVLARGLAGELSEDQLQIVRRVEERLDGLLALVNDLLALAASKTIALEESLRPVPLGRVINQIVDRLSAEARLRGIDLTCAGPPAPAVVAATEVGLERIFDNLIGNALKYTPAGGQVRVTVANANGEATVTVTDTGIGIPPADLPHLGEEFHRGANARETGIPGTGLGLSIVRQYVDRFGGRLAIESVVGEGTAFTVSLRRAE